jgi:predicted nucleotidyltransferase
MSRNKKILESIVAAVNKTAPDSEIYLFGSRARGDVKEFSDWDLLILLNNDNIPFSLETKIIDDLFGVELETGEVITPLIYAKNDWENKFSVTPLYENIEKEGVRIK